MVDPLAAVTDTLGRGASISLADAQAAVSRIIDGAATDEAIAAFLTALHERGETADALAGAVAAVRSRMTPLPISDELRPIVDTCGTGGDGAGTFNISTAAAIVLAACGLRVAKHGNRAATSATGSADVLLELGIRIDPPLEVHERCLRDCGITFLFAPQFHPALRHASAARRRLPFRTLFNFVGPLVNPCRPDFQLMGVPDIATGALIEAALWRLAGEGASYPAGATLVTGQDGLDELSLGAPSSFIDFDSTSGRDRGSIDARAFGLPRVDMQALRVANARESADLIRHVLAGNPGPARDIVAANAAFAMFMQSRRERDLRECVRQAQDALDSGAAEHTLESWIEASR